MSLVCRHIPIMKGVNAEVLYELRPDDARTLGQALVKAAEEVESTRLVCD